MLGAHESHSCSKHTNAHSMLLTLQCNASGLKRNGPEQPRLWVCWKISTYTNAECISYCFPGRGQWAMVHLLFFFFFFTFLPNSECKALCVSRDSVTWIRKTLMVYYMTQTMHACVYVCMRERQMYRERESSNHRPFIRDTRYLLRNGAVWLSMN